MRCNRILFLIAVASCLCLPGVARAQDDAPAGVTMTPAGHLLVNKQLGAERWTISVDLVPDAGGTPRVRSMIGNVFRTDSSDVSFVQCQPEPGSEGTLADPASTFLLRCKGTGACAETEPCEDNEPCGALACARDGWTTIAAGLEIPADFFLPPGGLWPDGSAAHGPQALDAPRVRDFAALVTRLARWLAARSAVVQPDAAHAQQGAGGATMSIDLLHHLVVRDRSGQRWSIVLNMTPDAPFGGGFKIASATGNVFTETGDPAFVFCRPDATSAVTLENHDDALLFNCSGAPACTRSAAECVASDWREIAGPIQLDRSFFLPEGEAGRGSPLTSDPELRVLGGVAGLPAIASREFHLPGASGQPSACEDGALCLVTRIGSCRNVPGRQIAIDGTCHCLVDGVSPHCVRCGTEDAARIPAACGTPCAFDVGIELGPDSESRGFLDRARGVCLPLDADSPHCFCHAIAAERVRSVVRCGDEACAPGECCLDDPRDGCRPLEGDVDCPGLCAGGVDGAQPDDTCGLRTHALQTCGDGVVEGSELCDPADVGAEALSCSTLDLPGDTFACEGCKPTGCAGIVESPEPELELVLPDALPQYGRTPIVARWRDADGDVSELVVTAPDGSDSPWSIPDAAGRVSGSFEFALGCNGSTPPARFDVHLVDDAGNESDPSVIDLQCVASDAVCGDGRRAEGEACDSSADGGSGCGAGLVCANDCSACNPADSCRGRCCPAAGTFCAPADLCGCDPGCFGRRDCCADASQECGL